MMRRLAALLTAAFGLASSVARAQHVVGVRDARALRADSVFQRFDRTDSPGCALGVYQDGRILYARGYGMASLEHGIALSPRSVLDVGSISKQFTAMAMLMLQKEGKLSLDDPLRKYIPEMPAYADRITLRRALSQTSGLRDLYVMMGQTGRTFAGDTIDALRVITHSAEPNYEPGARYLYTNSGWILAAQIVYRLTGKTLDRFAEERIFGPLGMRDTRYLADVTTIVPNAAEGYAPRPDGGFRVARSTYDGAIMGAGAVHTTIEDFGRWLDNYDAATVGGRDIIETMTTVTPLNDGTPAVSGPTQAYAIGLNVGTLRGLRVVSHGGSWAGYRGHFLRFPDQRFAVATFCNLTTSGPDSLARKVAGIYLGDRMQPDSAALWTAALDAAPRGDVPTASLRALAGVWRNVERGEVRRTRLVGDTLFAVGAERTRMVPVEGGRFRVGSGTEFRFERDGDAAVPTRMIVRTTGETVTYTRADTAVLTPARLAEYAGRYRSDEVDATHTWTVENGRLVVYSDDRRLGALEPTYADGFTRGGAVIDVQRDAKGRITGFVVESGRVRHLRFTRVR
ncbi:beta-lactamase (plasmid) [Gemmatirosa kalamazoonensis]|uniref:Beta-lactamase n=1 Tax=Gemmatirosa kalamazoonensis TaxID=861299 RepID=W0RNT8_9BACT|nr:serine hydrolase domain-containing protein [Gemmatirosa kalamazoonensis]AHG92664.1 beta-lactamase [Gemmatirosa kalamazoonensis]